MRILVVGSGAREHALAWRLSSDPGVGSVLCAPGNPLVAEVADVRPHVDLGDSSAIVELAQREKVDLVVIGPEAPLVAGLADDLAAAGIHCFGPSRAAARLEASKAFARDVCAAAGVAMAAGRAFDELAPAVAFANALGGRVVVKADGLAAGKGVTMCESLDEATAALREALHGQRFGSAGRRVVVEEWLDGVEASVIALCDGRRTALLPVARDHKRIGEGDSGPNTGGMGAYSPVAELDDDGELNRLAGTVFEPVLAEMAARGTPFRGALFAGLMLTSDGPRVLEFNVRLGDPETQAILPRLATPIAPLLLAAATGDLQTHGSLVPVTPGATVALTLASAGYPESPRLGLPIAGLAEARESGALVFGAGVRSDESGHLVTAGGRVLSVVGIGPDLDAAAQHAHAAADLIHFDGKVVRRDIGRTLAGVVA
jgi:phosphoribosylamine--glycine ligase